MRHNHFTRDIKPLGKCPACDSYHVAKSLITETNLEEIILQWQRSWMDVKGTDEKDRKNYFNRAAGIDANMRYSLARKLLAFLQKTNAPSES